MADNDPKDPDYMVLQKQHRDITTSQHGSAINLAETYPDLTKKPLTINGKSVQSDNPDRYKQHGFHFNADNCIACHACESACSEKNNLSPHLTFRKVGFIEGGTYPDVMRLNISMACNHCNDPVCLKGCPTLAYTKYVEYGAVLQDPNICFGCGYCTWVCPYNAPQLDLTQGHVEKCNMCIDRLEVGLKPACVSACLSHALDFGVIEDIPKWQKQAKLTIPGFPDPSITQPNIRFQQTRSLPNEFTRCDNEPIRYYKEKPGDEKYRVGAIHTNEPKEWGFAKLRSREDPLVAFTLLSQGTVGAFLIWFIANFFGAVGMETPLAFETHPIAVLTLLSFWLAANTVGLILSTLHLGKPQFCYRALNNLRHSWVSREILTTMTFFHLMAAYTLVTAFPILISWLPESLSTNMPYLLGWGAVLFGPMGLYCMSKCYRIPARPFWDHWHVYGAFFSSALILGSLTVGLVFGVAEFLAGRPAGFLLGQLALPTLAGLILQAVSLMAHLRYLTKRGDEAEVSRTLMLTTFGKTYLMRYVSLGILLCTAIAFSILTIDGALGLVVWGVATLLALVHEVLGRALFYVVVIPTTHPGSFFFGNNVFATHARKVGLAAMPQTGVGPDH
jgi:DMSO reductase iron-sulfur subunit